MRLGYFLVALTLVAAPVGAQPAPASKSTPPASAAAPKATVPTPASPRAEEPAGLIISISASAEELDKLPGVGAARAKAIIAHRPYDGEDDLARRKVIPQNVYAQIKDKIVARQGPAQAPSGAGGSQHATKKSK